MTIRRDKKPARKAIPKAQRDRILELFHHRCALCGAEKPHFHHIDEDPSNNHDLNLLPLCPTHHLTDIHDPTAPIDSLKLRLFREYRDPSILSPEFHPIFRRLRFVLDSDSIDSTETALKQVGDLVGFLSQFEKGQYYHVQVHELLPVETFRRLVVNLDEPDGKLEADRRDFEARHLPNVKRRISENRPKILELVVEMLRYQPWAERFAKRGLANARE